MQVRADQLPGLLQRGLKPLYLVYGDEPLLTQEAGDLIRAAPGVLDPGRVVELGKLLVGGAAYERRAHDIVVYNIAGVRDALSISEAATRYRVREYRLLLSTSDEDRKLTIGRLGEGLAAVEKYRKSY